MEFEEARPFLESNHRGVVTTFRRNGAAHSSIVVCGPYQGNMALVSVRGNSVKVRNLRRDSRCTVAATSADWRSYLVVEGQAQLLDYHNTDAEEVRQKLREVYRACGDRDHPDWDEYDRAMQQQDAVIVLVRPDRVYGRVR
ncbi:MAG TPA: TIGR03618 family F420-dependent PPOX class oxidoreductase [Dehalococcoidia bacterium]|nr:TIGR03618 family F420-dependent PPOX class oxidoreductase [Dehalococcoidia bacterium]